jgi:hypothetical protein
MGGLWSLIVFMTWIRSKFQETSKTVTGAVLAGGSAG